MIATDLIGKIVEIKLHGTFIAGGVVRGIFYVPETNTTSGHVTFIVQDSAGKIEQMPWSANTVVTIFDALPGFSSPHARKSP